MLRTAWGKRKGSYSSTEEPTCARKKINIYIKDEDGSIKQSKIGIVIQEKLYKDNNYFWYFINFFNINNN